MIIGRYTGKQQVAVLRALRAERGEGWGLALTRAEYKAILGAALVERYGEK